MWIPRQTFDSVNEARVKAEAAVHAVEIQNAQLTTHIEWMRARLTQIEFERAQLIQRYMGITMPVPAFEDTTTTHPDPNATLDFNDVGDAEAARMGIAWNSDGTTYIKK